MRSIMKFSKSFDSFVKIIISYDMMWIVNIIKFVGIILKSKNVCPSLCNCLSIKIYHHIFQIALTHIVIFYL